MITCRIIRPFSYPEHILQQTPGGKGIWDSVMFTESERASYDYVIVINFTTRPYRVVCPRDHVWLAMHEPPNEVFRFFHRGEPVYSRIFTSDPHLTSSRYSISQPPIIWQTHEGYSSLRKHKVPRKTKDVSFLTSLKSVFHGHRDRLRFLSEVRNTLSFDQVCSLDYLRTDPKNTGKTDADLVTRALMQGYTHVVNRKWDAYAPYKYSIVIENFQGPDYWCERLADCFLAYTMPIYFGCTNIAQYFPKESMIQIDIRNLTTVEAVSQAIRARRWETNLSAIRKARELVLNRYQFFPHMVRAITGSEKNGRNQKKEKIIIPNSFRISRKVRYYAFRLSQGNIAL